MAMETPFRSLLATVAIALIFSSLKGTEASSLRSNTNKEDLPTIIEDPSWNTLDYLGQVAAVAVDSDGNVHVFHRGNRIWGDDTFRSNNRLRHPGKGPIKNDTILVIDPTSGDVLRSWGANKFYMPHGLTIDGSGNYWITDVGLHQVFKFPFEESEPTITLGTPLIPGNDTKHFCKPTDVAVLKSGYFFVADGYCNSRIIMYSPSGRFMNEIGSHDGMYVPHSLALVLERDAICVADREKWRILCYAIGMGELRTGTFIAQISGPGINRVYGIANYGDKMFAINGPNIDPSLPSYTANRGVLIDLNTGNPRMLWGTDEGFAGAHDLDVTPDGRYVYVVEIGLTATKKVYRFQIDY